jgi:hypothetical protein
MPTFKRIQKRIEDLRQEPEHVRLRVASLLTAASGVVLVVLWITVLLPLQLWMTGGRNTKELPEKQIANDIQDQLQPQASASPRVGGIRQTLPTSSPSFSYQNLLPSFSPTPSPSPFSSPEPQTAPVQILNP